MTFAKPVGPLLLVCLLAACGPAQQFGGMPTPSVGYLTISEQSASLHTELPGRTAAYRIAEVRPQVSGIVQKRLYTEGALVREGQPLYQIDAAPYRAAYDSAAAGVSKAEANLATANLLYNRYQRLKGIGAVSQQDLDTATAGKQQADADLATARAALRSASISLAYTRISAPIAGRTATSTVTEGALVTANQAQALTTVQQLDPMYVDLTQSAAELLQLRGQAGVGGKPSSGGNQAKVRLRLANGSDYVHEGTLQFTGVTVSETTGAITLRAVFPNPDGQLLPGMFVRALVDQGIDTHAILVPQGAVARNERGDPTAMVVGADSKAEQRVLVMSGSIDNQWRVQSGLKVGDKLIVDGLQRVQPGAPVDAKPMPAASSATAAAANNAAAPGDGTAAAATAASR